jgi:hypothetical protein
MTSSHISCAMEVYLGHTSRIALKSGWFCYACKQTGAWVHWQNCLEVMTIVDCLQVILGSLSYDFKVYLLCHKGVPGTHWQNHLQSWQFCHGCQWVPACTDRNTLKSWQLCSACKPYLALTSRLAMTSSHVCYVTEVYLGHMCRITMKSGLMWDMCKGVPGCTDGIALKSGQFCYACKWVSGCTHRDTVKS